MAAIIESTNMFMTDREIDLFLQNALNEDMPEGDITTDNIIDPTEISYAEFIAKENGVISGINYCKRTFELISNDCDFKIYKKDGDKVVKGDLIATIKGNTRTILKGERTSLNLLQYMSGIATTTNNYLSYMSGKTQLLDTRKTTPGLRFFAKKAVKDGGGTNHRYGLSDMVLIKDNHIKAAGSITKAVEMVYGKVNCKIEVEVETLEQFIEALKTKCDIIMLDNMDNELMSKCVKINNGLKKLEASGNMTFERLDSVCKTGVDYISVGALTHSFKALDISLKFKDEK